MNTIVHWIETLPLPLLEGWGSLAYIVGFVLALAAYGGFTFRPGGPSYRVTPPARSCYFKPPGHRLQDEEIGVKNLNEP
jgi:hypothetical protein